MQNAKQRCAYQTWLHVRDDNPGAIELYRSLGFVEYARRTSWQAQPGQNTNPGNPGILVTRRTARDWPAQETWLRRLYPDLLNWYQPMPWNSLRPGFLPTLYRFMSEIDARHWVARTNSLPSAVVSWQAVAGHNNRLWVAVPDQDSGDVVTALLLHARCQLFRQDKLSLDFPAGQYNTFIEAAGFHLHRTLLWMKRDETSAEENRKSI
jgi:hypothetical protein